MATSRPGEMPAAEVDALVRAAQAGDEAAFSELVSAHLPVLQGFVGRTLNGHADVDDVVQETLVRAMRGLAGLREPDKFRSWLLAIAYRETQALLRRRTADPSRAGEPAAEPVDPDGDFAERTVSELMLADQRRELVAAARWLDVDDQRLLSLWWQETLGQLSRGQLAAALSVNPKHVAVRVQRMRAQLEAVRGVIRALRAAPRCPGLDEAVQGWNGVADPLWRKRLTRHVRDCVTCEQHAHGLVAPEDLLLGITALPLLLGVATSAAGGAAKWSTWAAVRGYLSRKAVAAAASLTVVAGGVTAFAVLEEPATPDAPAFVSPAVSGPPLATGIPSASPTRSSTPSPAAAVGSGVATADIFVAPGGSDSGDGTAARPYATLGKAVSVVRAGQTIALRGGTYRPTEPVEISGSGTAERRITISNYRDERPVLDFGRVPADKWGITQRADYVTVQGLEIMNSRSHAYVCRSCRYGVFQRLVIHDNARSSLLLRDAGTIGNKVLDCDFFDNRDPAAPGSVGVGLAVTFGSGTGNLIRGNRAFHNADDGFDFNDFADPLTVEYNRSYGNGVNRWSLPGWDSDGVGFSIGGGDRAVTAAHVLRHNAAWDNAGHGFDDGDDKGAMRLTNNTAFRNGGVGFFLRATPGTVRDNVAVGNSPVDAVVAAATGAGNSWQTGDGTTALFRSTDPRAAEGRRAPDGTLPDTLFLATRSGIGADMSGG
ncbi:sigma-70 family RNA polymerase sigma factor [Catellatospora sp. KI3]|uniref:sigma-70 family RNA polymerase sigma factor n=1 Tax=Catellatospora sp. KI3 TaxID=3041620 RepID=UPI0024829045|nr:sigma-70 family RNA polymerase sigma factor [Catellatospora sp. KI3]MDI1465385.1 sigma-70 family RNA polymerase sigma factor [Catellatospora sp. KI3]